MLTNGIRHIYVKFVVTSKRKFLSFSKGQRAKKGIFIATSAFTKDAREYAEKIESKIVLIFY